MSVIRSSGSGVPTHAAAGGALYQDTASDRPFVQADYPTGTNWVALLGFAGAAGGDVAQATSKSTGVTLNKLCGQIQTHDAALASGAKVSFVVSNSTVIATDVPHVAVAGGGTANAYRAFITAVALGSFTVTLENISAGSLSENVVVAFDITRAVAPTTAPAITSHPADGNYDGATPYSMTVVASGTSQTYQWYTGNSGDTSSPIAGATNDTYAASPTAALLTKYWCRVSNGGGTADSNAATVTYAPTTLPISFKMDFDADAGVTGTTNISAWANQGSVSFSVQDNGGGHMPSLNSSDTHFNGHNSVQFDAGDALYEGGGGSKLGECFGTAAKHFLGVLRVVSYGDGETCMIGDNSHATGKFLVRPNAGDNGMIGRVVVSGVNKDADAGSGAPAASTKTLVEVLHDGADLKIKIGSGSYVTVAAGTSDAMGAYFLMGNSSYGGTGAWKTPRMLGHNAVLSSAQLLQTRAYLNGRYALGLTS